MDTGKGSPRLGDAIDRSTPQGRAPLVLRRAFLLIVIFATAAGSCRNKGGTETGRAPGLSPVFVVATGASNLRSHVGPKSQSLTFDLATPYPARALIAAISEHLAAAGWHPTRNNWFNRSETSEFVRGWVQYTVVKKPGGKQRFLCRWWAQWVGPNGDVLDYSLAYLSPDAALTNTTDLQVTGQLLSEELATKLHAASPVTGNDRPLVLLPIGTPPNSETATDNSPDPSIFHSRPDGG